jgi:MSHA pilin protein MshC
MDKNENIPDAYTVRPVKSEIKVVMRNRFINNKGFTLIEVIAVLIVLGIVAAVVISGGISGDEATLRSAAEALKGHIRFAQMKALNSDAPNCDASVLMVTSAGGYSMSTITGADCTSVLALLPGAQNSTGISLPSGITLTAATVSFDRWGRPHLYANGTGASTTITLTLSSAGSTETITIIQNTGFVE